MQAWIPVVSSVLYFGKSVFSFRVDSILKWRVYIKLKVSWLRAFLWCMSQTSRDRANGRHVRTHEKNSGDVVPRLGTIIQSMFCAQSGASIRLTVWKWYRESRYPGALPPVLENFRRAFPPALGLRGCHLTGSKNIQIPFFGLASHVNKMVKKVSWSKQRQSRIQPNSRRCRIIVSSGAMVSALASHQFARSGFT